MKIIDLVNLKLEKYFLMFFIISLRVKIIKLIIIVIMKFGLASYIIESSCGDFGVKKMSFKTII